MFNMLGPLKASRGFPIIGPPFPSQQVRFDVTTGYTKSPLSQILEVF